MIVRIIALLRGLRRWIWLLLALALIAGAWRIFITRPREARQAAEIAGTAAERIRAVEDAAARGDDAEVQRRHVEAIERAEELLGRRR